MKTDVEIGSKEEQGTGGPEEMSSLNGGAVVLSPQRGGEQQQKSQQHGPFDHFQSSGLQFLKF